MSNVNPQTLSGRLPAPPDVQERVRALVGRVGTASAAKQLGIASNTVLAVLAGTPVLAGTIALVSARVP